jgi:hypothetical protein
VPLRKLDHFEDYAVLRDDNRKIEILIDHQLLTIRWDPSWSRWRDLSGNLSGLARLVIIPNTYKRTEKGRGTSQRQSRLSKTPLCPLTFNFLAEQRYMTV